MKKLIILLIALLPFVGFSQTSVDAKDVTTRRYIIWENDSNRNASTADSIMGFIDGSDTATMIPLPVGGSGYWTQSGDSLYPATATNNLHAFDSVYFSGLPIGEKDSIIYMSGDSLYKGKASSGLWQSIGGGTIEPITATSIQPDTIAFSNGTFWTSDGSYSQFGPYGSGRYIRMNGSGGQIGISQYYSSQTRAAFYTVIANNSGLGGNSTGTSLIQGGSSKIWATSTLTTIYDDTYFVSDVGIGISTPDSNLHVDGGAKVETDILVGGGWQAWTPTWQWTGASLGTPATVVAQYNVVNNVVEFNIYASGSNSSGSTATAVNITLPFTPDDDDTFFASHCIYASGTTSVPDGTRVTSAINALDNTAGNRKLYTSSTAFSIADGVSYKFVFTGKYKISGK